MFQASSIGPLLRSQRRVFKTLVMLASSAFWWQPSHIVDIPSFTSAYLTAWVATNQSLGQQFPVETDHLVQKLSITGQSSIRSLAGGKTHTYSVDLAAGQFLRVVVKQQGIDLIVRIVRAGGEKVAEVDRPNGLYGPEAVSLIAEETGEYRVEIIPAGKRAPTGTYSIFMDQLRQSLPLDRMRIAAEQAVTNGEALRAQQTVESKREAISQFELALGIWQKLGESYEEAVALYGLGLTCRQLGENQAAVNHFKPALTIMHSLGDHYGEAVAQTGLAWSYLYLGATDKTLDNFLQALRLRQTLDDRNGEALTLYGIGWAHANKDEPQQALDYFMRSLRLRRELGDRRGEAITLVGIGQIYSQLRSEHEALPHLRHALALVRELGEPDLEADALDRLGWVHLALNEVSIAHDCFQQALPLRQQVGDRMGEATVLYGLAQAEYRNGRLQEALDRMESSLALIELSRGETSSPQFRTSYFASVVNYYKFAISLLMQLHEQEPSSGFAAMALQMSERARARSLLDLLAEAHAELRSDVPARLLDRERALRQEINLVAERRRNYGTANASDSAKLNTLMSQHEEIEAQIRASSPRYAALTQPAGLGITELQQLLDDDTLLLEYSLGDDCSYLWVVTSRSFNSYSLPGRVEIKSAVRSFYRLLSDPKQRVRLYSAQSDQARRSFHEAAARLSRMILGPVAGQLKDKRLAIVADGALSYVPFAALPSPAGNADPVNSSPGEMPPFHPLFVDHEIISLPSASVLAPLRRQYDGRRPAPKEIAVFADPVFEKNDARVSLTGSRKTARAGAKTPDSIHSRLPRLPFTRREAGAVIPFVAPDKRLLALDFAANLATATNAEIAQYRIIHFATHSLLNNEHPELSGIALSLVDEQGRPQDGFVRLQDIYDLRLGADLVVLSACQTGLGQEVKGEGMIGLTRGFMYAGAPRVVATLWKVDDKATAELMKHFYKALLGEQRLRPASALRTAQIALWNQKRWRDPAYWAAFVLKGDWK